MAKAGGCRWFGLVSAASADAKSSFLYSRTKGETETDLTALEFPHLFIYRPGLLQCNRAESRPLERMAGWLAPIMNFCSGGRAAIPVETVAKVMVQDTMDTAITEARKEHTVELKTISNKAMIDSARLLGVS